MFVIITEPTHGPADEAIGTFSSQELAEQYLEENRWHKSIGSWWTYGTIEVGTNRARIHPLKSPQPSPKPRRRKRK